MILRLRASLPYILIILIALSVRFWEINRTGLMGDEYDRYRSGIKYISALSRLDFDSDNWQWGYEHPPVGKYFYGLAGILTIRYVGDNPSYPHDMNFTFTRVMSGLFQLGTVLVTFLLAKKYFGFRIGLAAALILSLIPTFIAYGRVAGLESPLAFFYTSAIFFFLKGLESNSIKSFFASAILTGLAIGTRFDAFLLLVLLFGIFVTFNFSQILKGQVKINSFLLFFPAVAGLVFVFSWPYLWPSVFKNLITSFYYWVPSGSGQGKLYYLSYFLVSIPVLLFAPLVVSFFKFFSKRERYLFVILLWFVAPFIFAFADAEGGGLRYVINMFIPFSILVAIGLEHIFKNTKLFILAVAFVVAYLGYWDYKVHPYYIDYYNEAIGGPLGASKKGFGYGIWGEGVVDAINYVNSNLPKNASLQLALRGYELPKIRSDIVLYPKIIATLVPGVYKEEEIGKTVFVSEFPPGPKADYLLLNQVGPQDYQKYYELTYSVDVMGAPLYELYKLKETQ